MCKILSLMTSLFFLFLSSISNWKHQQTKNCVIRTKGDSFIFVIIWFVPMFFRQVAWVMKIVAFQITTTKNCCFILPLIMLMSAAKNVWTCFTPWWLLLLVDFFFFPELESSTVGNNVKICKNKPGPRLMQIH